MSAPRQLPPYFHRGERGPEELKGFVASIPVYRPREIFECLRVRGYVGQDEAVRAVALWAYRHVSRLRHIHLHGAGRDSLPPKNNMLFVGPTGCGKTFLVELLFRDVLQLPTVILDITAYSETGYVGQDVATVLTRLLYAADFDPLLTSVGVICLDEFDKIASGQNNAVFAGAGTTKDVSGLGVQRELLKMLESAELPVPAEIAHSEIAPRMMISTRDIVFIASGGLKGLIQRSGGEHIGFGRDAPAGDPERIAVSYTAEELDTIRYFQSYGFLPELIGRFQRIVPFRALEREELAAILQETVLERYRNEFRLQGIALEVDEAVLERIVTRSLRMETGARGIEAAFIRHLEDAAFEAYSREDARSVRITLRGGQVVFDVG
jgi:ATP-dependent Clp protease ATP-binding subunit ClpX